MVYLLRFKITDIIGEWGAVCRDKSEAARIAKDMSRIAIDYLGDFIHACEWFDARGEPIEPAGLLDTTDEDELLNQAEQLNDVLLGQRDGYLEFFEYPSVFDLINDQDVSDWCSEDLKAKIKDVRKNVGQLIHDLDDEWSHGI